MMLFLSDNLKNTYVKIVDFNFDDQMTTSKFNNIGLYKGVKIFVKNNHYNKHMVHIVINDVEYVIRREDAKKIVITIEVNDVI